MTDVYQRSGAVTRFSIVEFLRPYDFSFKTCDNLVVLTLTPSAEKAVLDAATKVFVVDVGKNKLISASYDGVVAN